MGDDRSNVYMEDGIAVYRASSLGRCQRALVAARIGMPASPPPSWLQRLFDDGNRGEDRIIELLPEYGWQFDGGGQDEVELTVTPTTKVRGHIDGRGRPWLTEKGAEKKLSRESYLLEMKTMSPKVYEDTWRRRKLAAFPAYQWQGSIYGAASGLPVMFVIGIKKSDGSGDVDRLAFHRMTDEETIPLGQIKARVITTEALAKKGVPGDVCDVPAEGFCPAEFLCGKQETQDPYMQEPVSEVDPIMLKILAEEYEVYRQHEANAKGHKEATRSKIIELMAEATKAQVDGFTVTVSTSYPERFDSRAFQAAHPELYAEFKSKATEPQTTVKVTVK